MSFPQNSNKTIEDYQKFNLRNIYTQLVFILILILGLLLSWMAYNLINDYDTSYFVTKVLENIGLAFLIYSVFFYIRSIYKSLRVYGKKIKLWYFFASLFISPILFVLGISLSFNPPNSIGVGLLSGLLFSLSFLNYPLFNFLNDIFEYLKLKN